jgi:hypothetical protein
MRKLIYFLCLGLGLSLIISCQKDAAIQGDLQSILLSKDTLTMYTGDKVRLDYKISPATTDSTKLVWSSSDTTVVVVNKGVLLAKKEGKSTVIIKNENSTASVSCLVTVIDRPKPELIAYYPFNGTVADSSGNSNHGTAYGLIAVSNRFGKANSAYQFNGYNSYIAVPDKQPLRLSNTNFTLSAWVKLDANNYSYGSMILNKHLTGVNNGWTWSITGLASNPLSVGFFGPGGGSNNAYGTKAIELTGWHMITSAYNAQTKQLSMYIDGVLDNVTQNVEAPNGNIETSLYIGRDNPTIDSSGYFFQGAMDEIRIYGRLLSSEEIQKLYTLKK